jgi:Do/DeqQ family serine protease
MPIFHTRYARWSAAGAALLLVLTLLVLRALPALAALPPFVEGQPVPSLAPMLERVMPAVVNINSKTRVAVRNPFMDDPFFRQFFGMQNMPRERVEQSLGSGVIIDAAKGYVLTNNHVVEGADDISVTLHDGRTVQAQLVGTDPQTEVAVVKIVAKDLAALPLADSSKLRVGDFVVALGNPFGLGQTVTSGIVSALGRTGLRGLGYQNFIQTDASINPGNSGGALVDLHGELVGINTAIFSPSGGNVGIGFAIPSNLCRDVMNQLIATGTVTHGSLGVQTQDLTDDIARALGTGAGQGAVVTRVQSGSPAAAAGLQAGDIIERVDGRPVHGAAEFHNAEGLAPVGSSLALELLRDGKTVNVSAKLVAQQVASAVGSSIDARLTGADLGEADARAKREGVNGVRVSRVAANSRAAIAGLEAGDLIVGVNQTDISGLDDLKTVLASRPRQVLLSVVRGRQAFLLPLR